MRSRLHLFPWLLLFLLCVPGPAHGQVPPGYISEVLDNGLHVSILPDPECPLVATRVFYHVGSVDEDQHTLGFAHLFEHVMFGGTAAFPKGEIERHHDSHGGYRNAFTSFDETIYVSEIGPAHHELVLQMEADRMAHLQLSDSYLLNEKRIVTEELRVSIENSPVARLGVAALQAVLGNHPYAHAPTGTKETIAAATLDHARTFYRRYYRPDNAHLVIVGPVDGPATLAAVHRYFDAIPRPQAAQPGEERRDAPTLLGWPLRREVDLSGDIPPVKLAALAYPLPPPSSPENFALLVLEQLLTGGQDTVLPSLQDVLSGDQLDPLREELVGRRRKALYAGTRFQSLRRGGVVVFFSASLPYRRQQTAFRLLDEGLQTLARMDWLTEDKLRSAKRALLRKQLDRTYYAAQVAEDIGKALFWYGDERLAFDLPQHIQAVTLRDVQAVFRRYVLERQPVRLFIRPQHVPWYVTLFGWLYALVL